MAPSDVISGIGCSPLGNLGLGASGTYGAYDNYLPQNLAMNGMYNSAMMHPMFASSMSMMNPMMGMYNPLMVTQLTNASEQMHLQHAGKMHGQLLEHEVTALRESDSALMQKIFTNGHLQQRIQNLYEKVVTGDLESVCYEVDTLKDYIFATYPNEIGKNGDRNAVANAMQYIELMYSEMVNKTANDGKVHTLRGDIEKYGERSLKNGFWQGFRRGHQKMYVEEALNHCFDMPINQKETLDTKQEIGKAIGRVASVGEKALVGTAIALTGTSIVNGIRSLTGSTKFLTAMGKAWAPAALIGAAVGVVADIWWQIKEK